MKNMRGVDHIHPSHGVEISVTSASSRDPVSLLSKNHDDSNAGEVSWGHTVDERLQLLQDALSSALTLLHDNRVETSKEIEFLKAQIHGMKSTRNTIVCNNPTSAVSLPSLREIIKQDQPGKSKEDFRIGSIITVDEAVELLQIFITKMSSHMFGYNFDKISARELWHRSPLLLVSICSVACPHHSGLASKQKQLIASLNWFASQLLNNSENVINSEEIEHIILALIIASLWFEANQLYLSVALQLGRLWKIDEEQNNNELWKLWYLLYIADGAQNLLSQKSPSIYKQFEPTILSCRKHLVENVGNSKLKKVLKDNDSFGKYEIATNKQLCLLNEVEHEKIHVSSLQLQDMRLCGLVEYHMAIESIFHRKNVPNFSLNAASNLLKPSNFGIPWESNMDLDKWMVSWTITLQSIDVQNDAWCLKSTLLYYNFARMHLNTDWLLNRKACLIGGVNKESSWPEVWKSIEPVESPGLKNASHEISTSAAASLLKLATKDKDISSLFQFLPNHVYLMLFYASMIILEPPISFDLADTALVNKLQKNFNLVKSFRQCLASGASSDPGFTRKIIEGTDGLMTSFIEHCIKVSRSSKKQDSEVIQIIQNPNDTSASKDKRKTISAWPSINHGHP